LRVGSRAPTGERRIISSVACLLAILAVVCGCQSNPPLPLVSSSRAHASPTKTADPGEVVVGVDSVIGGYNPHALADLSTTTTALSTLLLPSVFRPQPDGTPQLDRTIATSAQVTKSQPFTVTYSLNRTASWSDGAPIAAEDFVYLRDEMRTQPGVVNPAGYRLISDISARDAGKTVEVTFAKPYPEWRSLFTALLPAHLLKDAPGGWQHALETNFPASGGPFAITTMDPDRGEIMLERNDRYWAKPAVLNRIVLRKADSGGLISALRSGDDQVAQLTADANTMTSLHNLGSAVRVNTVPQAAVAQLLLRPASPRMADVKVRHAIAAALDRNALITAGTANGPSAQARADAHVVAPSSPGYAATLPSGMLGPPDPAAVDQLLTEAGYVPSAGVWSRDGRPLTLVIAAPAGREPYVTIANQVQKQLVAAGIDAKVSTPTPVTLFSELLAGPVAGSTVALDSAVDIAVVPQPVGGDPVSTLASAYGCRQASQDTTVSVPANPAGCCDPALQPMIDNALTGTAALSEALSVVEPQLWQQYCSIPLFQLTSVLVTRPEVTGVDIGPPFIGPFAGASLWRRVTH
jgi:ABC-type transport system substrate-binding protein